MEKTTIAALGAAALLALGAGCASTPRVERHVWQPVGTTYTQQVRYTGSYSGPAELTTKIGTLTWKGQPHMGLENAAGTLVTLPSGEWVTQLAPDGRQVLSWDPPVGFNYPLEVGKSWTSSFKFTNHATNQSLNLVPNAVVEAYEDVVVPAGTFKAFRVRITNSNIGLHETFWYSPDARMLVKLSQRRTEASALGPGTREMELKSLTVAR